MNRISDTITSRSARTTVSIVHAVRLIGDREWLPRVWFTWLVIGAWITLIGLLSGCSSTPYVWASEVDPNKAAPSVEAREIGRGDVIDISVVGQAAISSTVTVGADGTISLPDVGVVAVAGRSTQDAASAIETKLSTILQEPKVSVVVVTRFIEVSLLGEVRSPGKYALQSGDGVANAIALAGGLTEFADDTSIFLVRADQPRRIRFRMKDLLRGGDSASAFTLRDGDILLVE